MVKAEVAAPLILGFVAAIPILVFFWSRWKLILGLIFGLAIVVVIVWIALALRRRKKKKCEDEKKKKGESFEEKVHGLLSELKPGISY